MRIQASDQALAAILADNSLITWGELLDHDIHAANRNPPPPNAKATWLVSSVFCFAGGGLQDQQAVTWGWPAFGGDSSAVQDKLRFSAAYPGHV